MLIKKWFELTHHLGSCVSRMADLYPGSKNKWVGEDLHDLIEKYGSCISSQNVITGKLNICFATIAYIS